MMTGWIGYLDTHAEGDGERDQDEEVGEQRQQQRAAVGLRVAAAWIQTNNYLPLNKYFANFPTYWIFYICDL